MLSLSYSQALADPTYCDSGIAHGKALADKLGAKHNQPYPLKVILPHCTLAEFLWCLRAVKTSQKAEADKFAWRFIYHTLMRVDIFAASEELKLYVWDKTLSNESTIRTSLLEDITYRKAISQVPQQREACGAIIAALRNDSPSQIAVNVSDAVIKVMAFDGPVAAKTEECKQRAYLESML
jgi:hypothetical protein